MKDADRALLIVGRAGTGKTTLIKEILKDEETKQVVLAPTGVAAIAVGGQTLHSFFRIPPGLNNPNGLEPLPGKPAKLIKSLHRIIIDEISMVRADLLDMVDHRLRTVREDNSPFGGVQIIMVGDFYQLPPVLTWNEREVFEEIYDSNFVFSAKVFRLLPLYTIELGKVYRQPDAHFVELLGNIRTGSRIDATLRELNDACVKEHRAGKTPMLLTAYNDVADRYNRQKLIELTGEEQVYESEIQGRFDLSRDHLPAPAILHLKVGARVMMLKNDKAGRWVNGSLAIITKLEDIAMKVLVDGDDMEHLLLRETWERYAYALQHGEIAKEVVGKYVQFPVKLAWASTIHKAQGLTIDDVRLDLSRRSFEKGQTYVALSRATTLDGLSFTAPLDKRDVIVDLDLPYRLKVDEVV